jgi:class 3 adenylate cyclase
VPQDFRVRTRDSVVEESLAAEAAERRVITCLFLDVVSSTELVRRLGPDRMHDELRKAFASVRDIVASHGGTIEKYLGDGVLAVFGAPVTHTDDPERALRAATDCVGMIDRRRPESLGIDVRIGVETGTALVGTNAGGAEQDHTLVGVCVNVAARLQAAAAPGQIFVGPGCHEAAAEAGEFEICGPLPLKGVGETNVWRLVRILEAQPVTRPPFVGRAAELEAVHSAYARARDGHGSLLLILGPPGQGKSRLAEEFVGVVGPEIQLLTARCRPDDETGSQIPLRQLLALDGQDATAASVRERLLPLIPDSGERERVRESLCHSAGLEVVPRLVNIRASGREGEFAIGWRRYIELLAQQRPVVLWIDDLHWAEPIVVRLVDRLTNSNSSRLLILATARPELSGSADLRPGSDHTQIELGPLDRDSTEALAKSVGTTVGADVERARGNPLFVLEMARSSGPSGEMPLTLQAAIGARLDELPGEERDLLQRAAVVGESFTVRDVALLASRPPADVAGTLARLAHLQYLTPNDGKYGFHHGLVRDVAYGRLGTGERLRLHARYAREGVDPKDVEILAHHWWEALGGADADWVWKDDPELLALRHEAVKAQLAAARRHSERASFEHGAELCERAGTLATGPEESAEVHELLASIRVFQSDGDRAWIESQRALDAYRTRGLEPPAKLYADATKVPTSSWGFFRHLPESREVISLLDEGIRVARSSGSSRALADLLAQRAHFTGDAAGLSEVMQLVEAAPQPAAYADVLPPVIAAQLMAGDVDGALAAHRRIDSLVGSGAIILEAEALLWQVLACYEAGDLAETERLAVRFREVSRTRNLHIQTHALGALAMVRAARGQWDEVRPIAEEVEQIVTQNPHLGFCLVGASALAWGAVGRILTGSGLPDSLRSLVDRMVPESPSVQASTLFLPYAMVGRGDMFQAAREAFHASTGEWNRQEWDPYAVNLTMGLAVLEQWNEMPPYLDGLRRVSERGARLPGAVLEAAMEEQADGRGGPKPSHESLRRLGYTGLSQILSGRAPHGTIR